MHYQFAKLCTRRQNLPLSRSFETSVFFKDNVFKVLSKLDAYVQGVRSIQVGFKMQLNTFLA